MVRLLNNFTRLCKTTETGKEICSCDYRTNIYDCPHSEFYVIGGKILIPICILATIMSGGFLYYLIKVKKQPIFLNATKERGWLRPKPLHSYHLIVFAYMFFQGLHLIFLVNELYPNMIAAELGNVMADACSAAAATLYPVSIVYSTPNINLEKKQNFKNFNYVGPNARLVDIVGIILFFEPLITLFPLASLAGHYAEMNDIKMTNILYNTHYIAWAVWEITYITVLLYYWYRLTSIIKDHLKVLEENDSNRNQIKIIKRGTRKLTIPVMAIAFGLLSQAIIYVIMCITHRSGTIYYFGWNLFYYWIGYVTFPLLGFTIECFLIYYTIKNLKKPPTTSSIMLSPTNSSQTQLDSKTTDNDNMSNQKDSKTLCCIPIKKFGITINKPNIIIQCSSETVKTVTFESNNEQEIP
ncbi:1672_t:CDS:2 [Funneliformis geosporum]|uniref:1672_t:CDS:1 n=1 Tax=Funneliformis geosporum TaxID=1117311 RepID=A0A9W4SBQ3_9GLOM|nr:1672_t:CDS:2 [Funneliformis geosporum]